MTPADLATLALGVRCRAHAPYSKYRVGAALLGKSGRVYLGCNVENASFGLTICAERAAFCRAIADGEADFDAIAIATEDGAVPCGACLQVAAEFGRLLTIHLVTAEKRIDTTALDALLPRGFDGRSLPPSPSA